jgi:hypothetical protein
MQVVEEVAVATRQVVGPAGLELEAMAVVEAGLLEQTIAAVAVVVATTQQPRITEQEEVLGLLSLLTQTITLQSLQSSD